MGAHAVQLLVAGQSARCVGLRGEALVDDDLLRITTSKRPFNEELHRLGARLF